MIINWTDINQGLTNPLPGLAGLPGYVSLFLNFFKKENKKVREAQIYPANPGNPGNFSQCEMQTTMNLHYYVQDERK